MSNYSFEIPAIVQGEATTFIVTSNTNRHVIGFFTGIGSPAITWESVSTFDLGWRLPATGSGLSNEDSLFEFEITDLEVGIFASGYDYEDFEDYITFINDFGISDSEIGILDTMEYLWLKPGVISGYTNDWFLAQYYDGTQFLFDVSDVLLGITDTFEAGWDNNDAWHAKYWSGSEYILVDTDSFNETFESGWILTL